MRCEGEQKQDEWDATSALEWGGFERYNTSTLCQPRGKEWMGGRGRNLSLLTGLSHQRTDDGCQTKTNHYTTKTNFFFPPFFKHSLQRGRRKERRGAGREYQSLPDFGSQKPRNQKPVDQQNDRKRHAVKILHSRNSCKSTTTMMVDRHFTSGFRSSLPSIARTQGERQTHSTFDHSTTPIVKNTPFPTHSRQEKLTGIRPLSTNLPMSSEKPSTSSRIEPVVDTRRTCTHIRFSPELPRIFFFLKKKNKVPSVGQAAQNRNLWFICYLQMSREASRESGNKTY